MLYFSIAAAWGSKMVFACAEDDYSQTYSDSVYVYDTVSRQWSKFRTSSSHSGGAAVACNGKVFLAGGYSGSLTAPVLTAAVDVYDVSTGQWTIAQLSSPRAGIVAAAAGNTVIFAGGSDNNNIDIFDMSTNQWTTGSLSVQRADLCAAGAGTKIIFAGGFLPDLVSSDAVDIYDVSTKLWSTAQMSVARAEASAAAAGNKIVVAGGLNSTINFSNAVDIYDVSTGEWAASTLNGPGHYYQQAVSSGNMTLFEGGEVAASTGSFNPVNYPNIDVYNATTGEWGYTPLHNNPYTRLTAAATGSQVLFAYCPGESYRADSVEIYHLQ
jgi:hypothetical protein